MRCWFAFVLSRICRNHNQHALILIDETKLIGGFKAIVAALPFRHRAIPIYWHIYKDSEIRSLEIQKSQPDNPTLLYHRLSAGNNRFAEKV